ncbi:putative negative regulator of DNA transposition [Rosellinia necatrix]|uniref:Putative negative regulator of DNA transposition n=1 Tax=Rosellinia necatrix TaxID=77044 RepID=A0A1W2TK25_ROSNE|nr:putative negative regulator of DNA transposition [Rosellinia necatrix]
MSLGLDSQKLNLIFQSRPDIVEGIQHAADSPSRIKLFNDIVGFVYEQLTDTRSDEPAQKRRRVDVEPSQNGQQQSDATLVSSADSVSKEDVLLEIKDISVSIPQRKKFDLCFTASHLYARIPGTKAPVPGIIFPWKSIEYAFYLPVPEKAQVQHNYILLPRNSYFPSQAAPPTPTDPLVFTIPATAPKPGAIGGPNANAASAVSDSYSTLFHWAINKCLQAGGNQVKVVAADPSKFHSVMRQPHRPREQAVHVKAFRGSKDGFIFFLENGIFWGFKKPLMFLPLDRIAAVSFTNVLQRTFNMVVEIFVESGDGETTDEIEFAMLDQADYDGINENYIARHKLQDRSLADQRKAKRELIENSKGKKGAGNEEQGAEGGAAGDGMTELERAQLEAEQQLQDEEDEDEEDYDPGSEGESEGSGSSSDEDDDDDEDAGEEDDDGSEGDE